MLWFLLMSWLAFVGDPARLDGAALEAELDAIVSGHIQDTGVPGVVVAVTEGHEVLVLRGWGTADVESGRPMDPAKTLVRIASLSKTFTATAVAQLEDRGLLDVDRDVDDYLRSVRTAGPFAQPVTVRHLLAHTSGFINYNSGRVSREPPGPDDLDSFIARTMPPRLFPPGTATVYTNHGNALAGLVVRDVAGVPFAQHIRSQILNPLQMGATTYDLDPGHPDLAASYDVSSGETAAWPYEYFHTVPASAVHTTAADMAHYLMMHATDGTYEGQAILSPAALTRMRTPQATIHPALPQFHYAFAPTTIAGRSGRRHGGSVPAFLSQMVVFDGWGVGVFVAQNAFGPNVADAVALAVARALPDPDAPSLAPALGDGKPGDPDRLVGRYRVVDKHETAAFTRARAVLWQAPLKVGLDDEGFLSIGERRFIRTGDLVFRSEGGDAPIQALVFVMGDDGNAAWLHRDRTSAFRPPWHAGRALQIGLHALALLLLVAGAAGSVRSPRPRLWVAVGLTAIAGAVGPQIHALVADAGQPVYTHPLRLGIPMWIPAARSIPGIVAAVAIAASLRRSSRHAAVVTIAVGALLLTLLQLYWQTPPPGLPRV